MKNLKMIFAMVALAIVAAACSNDDDALIPQQPEHPATAQGIPFTATISGNQTDGTTRAVGEDGTTIKSDWAVDETVAMIYEVSSVKYNTTATVQSVDGSGNATISATLQAGVTDGTGVTLIYPASAADGTTGSILATVLSEQDGTLSAARDVRKGTGTIRVNGTATLSGSTTLAAEYAICKFSVQDLSGTALSVTSLKVSDASGNVITSVTPASAASTLYVSLPASTDVTWFSATGSDSKPYIAKGTASLTAGKAYQPTLKMATLGDLMGANGKFYATSDAISAATTTAIGVIAHIGSDACSETTANGGGHGLVLCLKNAASDVCWSTDRSAFEFDESAKVDDVEALKRTTNVSGYSNTNTLAAKENASTKYPAAYYAKNYTPTAPAGTTGWFLPSAQQWVKMQTGLGGLAENTIVWKAYFDTSHTAATAWENALAKAGEKGTAYDSMTDAHLWYWSSSECSANNAVVLDVDATYTGDNYGFYWLSIDKDFYNGGYYRVRPVLAF